MNLDDIRTTKKYHDILKQYGHEQLPKSERLLKPESLS